ncbi:FadR/GntR family transcriptional regulator [Streptomyces chartreusis]
MNVELASARQRKPQQVVEALLAKIRSGDWPVGSRLPSEREIASQQRVSRNAIREALVALQLSGYIEKRVGDGSYITHTEISGEADGDAGVLAGMGIAEALEVREALEMASAFMAIRKATRSDLLKIDAIVAELEEHLERDDFRAYLVATLDLHIAVAAASHNPFLAKQVTELTEKHRDDQWLVQQRYCPEIAAYSLDVHRALAQAIRNRDPAAAADATQQHYHDYPALKAHGRYQNPSAAFRSALPSPHRREKNP